MEIMIKDGGDLKGNPKNRILAVEAVAKAISQEAGTDPAECVMMLLTAAAHIATKHSGKPVGEIATSLAAALGAAIVAADGFFTPTTVQ